MKNYYNEFDPFASEWLKKLINQKVIPNGDVDNRSITEVHADDLKGYKQCHFFAGIGGWSEALRLANWPPDRNVWTGSCPCQPFSYAGNKKGKEDERHLWPVWFNLIRECRPATIFGEQVASAVAHGWLDDVYQGMESEGYAIGAAILPACGGGAPHKRDRLFFVGDSKHYGSSGGQVTGGDVAGLPDHQKRKDSAIKFKGASESCNVANTINTGLQGEIGRRETGEEGLPSGYVAKRGGGFWDSGRWIACPDGKQRIVEPSICLLADGVSNRVGKLRGYGNAIVPQVASEFIKTFLEI